eukprot:245164_1
MTDKKGLESHIPPPDYEEEEKTEMKLNSEDVFDSIDYSKQDDPMMVEFNEEQWLPCIPGISLTLATLIFAIIGAGVGFTIALVSINPVENTEIITTPTYANMTQQPYDSNVSYDNHDIQSVYKINNTVYLDYVIQIDVTEELVTVEPTLSDEWEKIIAFPGTLWVNALKLLVLPLIILMMVVLPSRVDEIGWIGKRAVPLYLFTSTCAAIQGTIWAWIIQPGAHGEKPEDLDPKDISGDISELDAFLNIFTVNMVPKNIVKAMSDLTILGVILFFLTIGILLRRPSVKPIERDTVLHFSRAVLRCCMMAVVWVIWFTPIGMGSLVCIKIASTENLLDLLSALGLYLLTVIIGHSIHVFGFYPAVFYATTRGNGWAWFVKIYEAPMIAFATSSSAATLPTSLPVAATAGVRKKVYQFILPLGAAINMDGTALGFPIMVALIAQLNNVELQFGQVIVVLLLSVVVSVGTAPIPNAGMVYITMLFEAAGIGHLAGEGLATLFVLDWFVDRVETAVNVTSDQFVAKILDDVLLNVENQNGRIVCGCCLGRGSAVTGAYTQTETSTPLPDKEEQTQTV